ncbi:hypothetical protein HNV11_17015 [Spirosoma taeanense]|uniref:Outer membrane protein beta-barrel domain-containing protein n=1 Tax=Spirosoma taeanense TaxID=2735870 RepID=A0A6M5YCD8_9BACT|nr:hypothetical protein [Spirosoma taeanense]QJW90956.1 hypothetical protein HNV11_17015 [Spirosoma taeanense]
MKTLLKTLALLSCLSLAGYGQNGPDSTRSNRPLLDEDTKQEARQKAAQVEERLDDELERSRNYQQTHQLSWFQPGTIFAGAGIGLGAANGQAYTAINTRVGYFFQPGFAGGLRYDFDRLVGNKYHSRQVGIFARYYPFRTRISSFLGASLNSGREFSSTIPADTKSRYTSVGLEIGLMAWILRRLGAEITYEGNFYNKIDPTASRGKGGRLKFGVNYYFGSVGSRGLRVDQ